MIIPSSEVHFGTLSTEKHYEMSKKTGENEKKIFQLLYYNSDKMTAFGN